MLIRLRFRSVPLRTQLTLLAVMLTVALCTAHTRPAAAQPTPPAQLAAAGIEGSWSLRFPAEEPTSRQLAAFLPGGVVVATNAPGFSEETAGGGRVHSADGLGAWTSLGDGRYAFTVVFLYFDAEENNWGALTVDGVVTLDPSGNQFSGTFSVTVTDTADMPLFSSQNEPITGSRIRPRTGG